MRRFSFIIITFLLLLPLYSTAQSVGLVMSGGGAKGLYHIGVLRALEQNQIPIDYIAGTSMGSIIGGMYASGYSIDQMESVALSGDMSRWVSGRIDNKYTFFYTKENIIPSMIAVPINSKKGGENSGGYHRLLLPESILNTAEIDVALNNFFAAPSAVAQDDFDNLMIPFRCVATDIYKHSAVELKSGNLARAIRASMALPVAFPPVSIDSVLMCDGGCYDNFPWQLLDREFNPDIIIGACCVDIEAKPQQGGSVVDQVMSLITMPSNFDMPEDRSVLIQRAVEASTLDFDSAEEIIAQGYNDAMAAMPRIKAIVTRRVSEQEMAAKREAFKARYPKADIGNINVLGLNAKQTQTVTRLMNIGRKRTERKSAIPKELAYDNYLTMLANTDVRNDFHTMTYNDSTALYDLNIPLWVKPNFEIKFGGNISSTAFNQAYIGLKYSAWGKHIQSVDLDLLLGPVHTMTRLRGRTTFISKNPIYLDYSLNFNITTTLKGNFGNLTSVDNAEPMKVNELFAALSTGVALSRKSLFDATLHIGRNGYSYEMEGFVKRQYTHFEYIALKAAIERNSLNKPLFPTSGSKLSASAIYVLGRDSRDSRGETTAPIIRSTEITDYYNARREWWGVKASWEHYFDFTNQGIVSLGHVVEGVYTTHPSLDSKEATILSAPHYAPLLHSRMIYMPEFRANYYIGVGVMPTVKIINNLYTRLSAYMMMREKYNGSILHFMADLSIIYHTPIGPISLSLTKYNFNSTNNLYLTFNFGYAIFGKKGLFY